MGLPDPVTSYCNKDKSLSLGIVNVRAVLVLQLREQSGPVTREEQVGWQGIREK